MTFFNRTERGILQVRSLNLQIFFGELFEIAETEDEVEWILDNLQTVIEILSEERIEHLEEN